MFAKDARMLVAKLMDVGMYVGDGVVFPTNISDEKIMEIIMRICKECRVESFEFRLVNDVEPLIDFTADGVIPDMAEHKTKTICVVRGFHE